MVPFLSSRLSCVGRNRRPCVSTVLLVSFTKKAQHGLFSLLSLSLFDCYFERYVHQKVTNGGAKIAQTKKEFAISLIEEFPNFADAKIAKLAKVEEALVCDLRKELDTNK